MDSGMMSLVPFVKFYFPILVVNKKKKGFFHMRDDTCKLPLFENVVSSKFV